VLRFDFHGLGDAEGEAPEALLADLYGATQAGRYIADTTAAMDWMQASFGLSRFVAAGLCGGALTGLLAAEHDRRIEALLALSIPVIVDGSGIDAATFMTDAQLAATRDSYLERFRLWDARWWQSWVRFFTFQSDYRQIARALVRPLAARLTAGRAAAAPAAAAPADNTNRRFAPAFRRMVESSRPVLLVFAEADRLYWEFDEKFMSRHRAAIEPCRGQFDVHVVPQANHIFSFAEWQAETLDLCARWLEERIHGRRLAAAGR
jgi:pimeloyl-ACP methyl ester carboxylesterase